MQNQINKCLSIGIILTLFACSHQPTSNKPNKDAANANANAISKQNDLVTCLGPENAKKAAVYLHGLDTVHPSVQEMQNRKTLSEIAKNLNLRIAVPRAPSHCQNG